VRICSLVPAATEILFALGLGDQVVGVTHECDWPPEAAQRPAVTAALVETAELTSVEIDQAVADAAGNGKPLYAVDADVWAQINADVVIAQELCEVCAVSTDQLDEIVTARSLEVEVVDFSPSTLEHVLACMRSRLDRVRAALAEVETHPRVFISEWLDPPFAAGHWVPDMVATAGGIEVAGMSGEPSHRMRWTDVVLLEPDVVVLAPCGFDLDRTLSELVTLDLSAGLLGTAARQESRVFAVDANANFSRPGPRLVDGVELLAYLLHPEAYSDPGIPWSRVRL
jgi:iron complex transport system substrate-binding protein